MHLFNIFHLHYNQLCTFISGNGSDRFVEQHTSKEDDTGPKEKVYGFQTAANSCQKMVFGAMHGKKKGTKCLNMIAVSL